MPLLNMKIIMMHKTPSTALMGKSLKKGSNWLLQSPPQVAHVKNSIKIVIVEIVSIAANQVTLPKIAQTRLKTKRKVTTTTEEIISNALIVMGWAILQSTVQKLPRGVIMTEVVGEKAQTIDLAAVLKKDALTAINLVTWQETVDSLNKTEEEEDVIGQEVQGETEEGDLGQIADQILLEALAETEGGTTEARETEGSHQAQEA